jgi:putative membrane protein
VGKRWPGWVYDEGQEPDARFSLANERTFLAWVRTALALLAGGVALEALRISFPGPARQVVSVLLILLALCAAVTGWVRWARSERAMRRDQPLPGSLLMGILVGGFVVVGVVMLVVLLQSS